MYIDIEDVEKLCNEGPPPHMDRVIRCIEGLGGFWENRGNSESGQSPESCNTVVWLAGIDGG